MTTQVTGNKGEWSEFYAFLKILELKKLPAADATLVVVPGKFVHFLKIHRHLQNNDEVTYDLTTENKIILRRQQHAEKIIPITAISSKTREIFQCISQSQGSSFKITKASELANLLLCDTIKASNTEKADIVATVLDQVTDTSGLAGFSVKSMIGGAATLLNAGKTTNFEYIVEGINKEKIDAINRINTRSKIRDRTKAIFHNNGRLVFDKTSNVTFSKNMRKIDTMLPEFLSEMLIISNTTKNKDCLDLVKHLAKNEDFHARFGLTENDYKFKIQQLLIASALGMMPSKPWNGLMQAHGGYIIVKKTSDVICYHAFDRDLFLEYLINNTKFDGASVSRHEYATLYEENGQIKFKLNLQIRFK